MVESYDRIARHHPRNLFFDPVRPATPAAVMLLIHRETDQAVFIIRSPALKIHPGQIGLPGGRVEEGEGPLEAAFREISEEIAMEQKSVEVIGEIDRVQTHSDYLVHTYVALWEQTRPLRPDQVEISAIFEIPVVKLLDPSNCRLEIWEDGDRSRLMHFWEVEGRTIWGVTGDILNSFFQIMTGEELVGLLPLSPSRQENYREQLRFLQTR